MKYKMLPTSAVLIKSHVIRFNDKLVNKFISNIHKIDSYGAVFVNRRSQDAI
jgi:hypothetical protein